MEQRGTLVSVLVGMPQTRLMPETGKIDLRTASWTSGIYKTAASGPVWVGVGGMRGDGQADLKNHGGPDNVVLAYDTGHYAEWRAILNRPDLEWGSFGENFAVEGFSDDSVCIGDVWRVGDEVELQVSQPRQPCWKLARRIGDPRVVKHTMERGWGGWYLRVLKEGQVQAGMSIERIARPHAEWPVRAAVWLMYERKKDRARAAVLAGLPELSARWKEEILEG
jgi:MOSC domain-containing protein YiiM